MSLIRKRVGEKLSRVVIHNDTVYLCGQIPVDTDADIVAQSQAVLASLDDDLAEAGTDNSKLLSALIHIKHNEDVATFNEIWNAWLPEGCAPARTCVQSVMANDAVLVEVTVTAAL